MEGVGARLGRSSTRYGPTTVFTGPVRKWKKRWVPFSPSNYTTNHTNHNSSNSLINGAAAANGTSNGGGLHLVLYKWTPLADKNSSIKQDSVVVVATTEDRPKRKFLYIPIAVIEEQIKEDLDDVEKVDEETFPTDTDPTSRTNIDFDEKPDINDVPMEENQVGNQVVGQDLNESLDLSLG